MRVFIATELDELQKPVEADSYTNAVALLFIGSCTISTTRPMLPMRRWAGSNPKVEIGTFILAILGPLQDLQIEPIYLWMLAEESCPRARSCWGAVLLLLSIVRTDQLHCPCIMFLLDLNRSVLRTFIYIRKDRRETITTEYWELLSLLKT